MRHKQQQTQVHIQAHTNPRINIDKMYIEKIKINFHWFPDALRNIHKQTHKQTPPVRELLSTNEPFVVIIIIITIINIFQARLTHGSLIIYQKDFLHRKFSIRAFHTQLQSYHSRRSTQNKSSILSNQPHHHNNTLSKTPIASAPVPILSE